MKLRALLSTIWDFELADPTWFAGIADGVNQLATEAGATLGTFIWAFTFDADGLIRFTPRAATGSRAEEHLEHLSMIESAPIQGDVAALYKRAPVYGTSREVLPPRENRDHVLAVMAEVGILDSVGTAAGDAVSGAQIQGLSGSIIDLADRPRWTLAGITADFSAALRLRNMAAVDPDAAAAVLSADGDVLDDSGGALRSEGTRDRVRRLLIEQRRARDGAALSDAELIDAWRSLVDGEYTLVDAFEKHGRRLFLLLRNPYQFRNPAALSDRQRDVVALAARGQDNAVIGMTLGLSPSTAASHLSAAMTKLGIRGRSALARYLDWECGDVARLTPVHGPLSLLEIERAAPPGFADLTDAEREVAILAARGASNAEIAAKRKSSARTVANQLAAIYRKMDLASRFELASLVPAGD